MRMGKIKAVAISFLLSYTIISCHSGKKQDNEDKKQKEYFGNPKHSDTANVELHYPVGKGFIKVINS